MSDPHTQRRLAAILHADVAGYSRLTGEDEVGTHATVSQRLALIARAVEARGGEVGNFAGDAILAQFPSAVSAVACAVEVQRDFAQRNQGIAEQSQVRFRIGINLGDVIVDQGEPFGDGVNVAARLEALADPGGICISGTTYDALGNSLPLQYEPLGEQTVKNIVRPVRAYRVIAASDAAMPPAGPGPPHSKPAPARRSRTVSLAALLASSVIAIAALAWLGLHQPSQDAVEAQRIEPGRPDKPSLAVLPFENLSADPEQSYFADGIVDDLITDLSQIKALFVVGRQAAFAFKGQDVDLLQAGRDLGVRYILQGSVRKAGEQIRINAQLTDTTTGGQLWAERYDRELAGIFDLQDEVTARIVDALSIRLTQQELTRLSRRYTEDPDAYDYFLQGQEYYFRLTAADNARARDLYRKAIERDPAFGRAYGALAITYARAALYGWTEDSRNDLNRALNLARRAVALASELPQAHWALGFSYVVAKQHENAAKAAEQAIAADPNYADAYGLLAWIQTFSGNPEQALKSIDEALRIDPNPGGLLLTVMGEAQYWTGQTDAAVDTFERMLARNPNLIDSRLHLAAAYARLGRQGDAEWQIEEILSLNPRITLEDWARRSPMQDPQRLKPLLSDLKQAGLR